MNAFRTTLLFVLLSSSLAGCTTSLVYNRLDSLITWYVDDYVDLESGQKDVLQNKLEPALRWHRQEELANYVSLLDSIEKNVADPVSVETVSAWTQELVQAYRRVQLNLIDVALEFGTTLSDEQMQEFVVSLQEKQDELEEEYLERTAEDYGEDNFDRLEDNLSDYLGTLTTAQEAILEKASASLQRLDVVWLNDREQWLQRITPLLKREPGWQSEIRTLYENREQYRSEEYRRVFAHNMGIINQAIADVLNQRSDRQQRTLLAELADFREELQTLIVYQEWSPTGQQRRLL